MRLAEDERIAIDVDTTLVGRPAPNELLVWIRERFSPPRPLDSNPKLKYSSLKLRFKIDCGAWEMSIGMAVYYDADGMVLETESPTYTPPQSPIPDSIGEDVVKGVCARVLPLPH